MKKQLLSIATALLLGPLCLFAQVNPHSEKVREYPTKHGTDVKEHQRTVKNRTTRDNYSHKGNTNPNTGKKGYSKK